MKRLSIASILLASLLPVAANAATPIPLGELVETFMVRPGENPDWTMGADDPRIEWTTEGVAYRSGPSYSIHERLGHARVTFGGKEHKTLKKRVVPVEWQIAMTNELGDKWPIEQVEIGPGCAMAESCPMDTVKNLKAHGIKLQRICNNEDHNYRHTGYKATKDGKQAYILDMWGVGSGGVSEFVSVAYSPLKDGKNLCSL